MIDCRASDHEIQGHAIWSAGRVRTLLHSIGKTSKAPTSSDELTQRLNAIGVACKAGMVNEKISLEGRIARMTDAGWFKRRVRRALRRENEAIEHAAGHIRKKKACYVSDHAMLITQLRDKANRQTLENLEVCNELGEAFNLLEVADKSISNPKLRRGELMMRARGFEETAAYMGHAAVFLTITAPSRFHRFSAGHDNKKWTGDTPKDAQKYLCKTWDSIRKAWNRKGFSPYGFRVAEPHHEACPHWHVLLFMPKEQQGWFEADRLIAGRTDHGAGIVGIAGKFALKDSPAERGASQHRFTVKIVDSKRGSAAGYIAKYIAKNIDGITEQGENVGLDFASGKKTSEGAPRARTWAATWGIRQFQQIGGPSVTVYRELRRMRDEIAQPVQAGFDFEIVRSAADRALWSLFWILQGGPDVKRKDLTMRPFYAVDSLGKYGDEIKRVYGVLGADHDKGHEYALQTRKHVWTVQRAGLADANERQEQWNDFMDVKKATDKFFSDAGMTQDEFHARQGAWTGVNNCPPLPGKTGFDFSGFERESMEIPYFPQFCMPGEPDLVAEEVKTLEDLWEMTQFVESRNNYVRLHRSSGATHTQERPSPPALN